MKQEVTTGRLPPRQLRYPELGRAIVDGWKLGSSPGSALIELEDEYRFQ